jgi:alanyl-tRNA synthetase
VVLARIDDLPPETLLPLAAALTVDEDMAVLLGAGVADTGRLVFARGEDVDLDMSGLLKDAAAILGGGGGGQPDHATGGGPRGEALDQALTAALEDARTRLEAAITD